MSVQMSVFLLDKSVLRRAAAGLVKLEFEHMLGPQELEVLSLIYVAQAHNTRLFVQEEAYNILSRFPQPEIRLLLSYVEVMKAARYFKRWARRLRSYGFTREDAKLLALAVFGTDEAKSILGVQAILTLDASLIQNYRFNFTSLEKRLKKMRVDLPSPYNAVELPLIMSPGEALALWGIQILSQEGEIG